MNEDITIVHNFEGNKFMWLYAKYATGANPEKHCTNAIKGKYSKKFTKHNPTFETEQPIIMDEFNEIGWDAIYICGVIKKGYPKTNYPHNVHLAIIPKPGNKDIWSFEQWSLSIENGAIEPIITEEELDSKYALCSEQCKTCRMFRWVVSHYKL